MADMMKAPEGEGSILDILLGDKVGNVERELPEARYWMDRLSEAAGEIVGLSQAVERLSGYRRTTITEIKNAWRTAGTGR